MSTVADYVDRQIDVLAFDNIQEIGEALSDPRLAAPGEGGKVISGIAKLSQRFLLRLLTIRGSIPYLEEEGTDFLGRFRRGEVRTQLEAEQAFQSAMVDLRRQFFAEQTDDQPEDEQFAEATLLQVVHLRERVVFRIEITSAAGTRRKLLLPLTSRITGGELDP